MSIVIYTEADLNGMSDAAIAEYLSMLAERLQFMSTDDHKPFAPVIANIERVQKQRLTSDK